ncbi:MAG: hypothetical protein Q8T11_07020 [Elusimicrobiota bacterium]|nr:hypothetical protein [Elusimicrobiota bacterium]
MMRVYGWLFLATGVVFVAAPRPLTALLGLPNGGPGLWLGLAGSLMAVISLLSFQIEEEPFLDSRWNLLLLSKAVSSLLFAAFAATEREPAFLVGAAVDSAILLHLALLRAGVSRPYRSRAACAPVQEAWFVMVQDHAARRGFWARYAVSRGLAECRAVLFDKAAGRAEAERWERPAAEVESGPATAYRLEGFSLAKGRATGPTWLLTWPEAEVGLLRFAPRLLSGAGLVRGGYEAVEGLTRVTGEARVGGLTARFADAPAGVGHLWSPRGARGWRWTRAVFPLPGGATVFELLTADAPVLGGLRAPLTAARLVHEGRAYACVGVLGSLSARSVLRDGTWSFRARLGAVVAEGECRLDESLAVEFPYASPSGPGVCRTSMTGSMRLTLTVAGAPPVGLSTPEDAIVELAALS